MLFQFKQFSVCVLVCYFLSFINILLQFVVVFGIRFFGLESMAEKGLSDSSSEAIFRETFFNEGLKFSVFSYLICRYKCFGPNKTNFMNFGQKLWIFGQFYENKRINPFESSKSAYFRKVALNSTIFDQNP